MDWQEKIREGLNLIIKGCEENTSWKECENCPFDIFCTSIYKDNSHHFSTPDCYREEGYRCD